ncbi:MAG: SDR family NAD(P)-dependent oxidoreductase [Anaerolineales bacterium]|nr:SDR family NAD(P)-dependent oxidoreductase [Anaerolineales bacterium]
MHRGRKIVAVSGASSGLGGRIAERLGRDGNTVFAGARKESDIGRLSSLENVTGVRLDVTDGNDIVNLARRVESGPGRLDALINNAGVIGWGALMDRDVAYFQQVIDVNVYGAVRMVQALYPLLRKSASSPVIINMSSVAGTFAFPYWAPYHMAKWALEAFSDSLRRELNPLGIRVAVIRPGAVRSQAFRKERPAFEEYKINAAADFRARAVRMLAAAFENPARTEKDPEVVVRDVLHAVYHENSRLYYSPGRRIIPDLLAAKLPAGILDWVLSAFLREPGKTTAGRRTG